MTREPATTTRAVLMAAIDMRLPSERIEAILDHLLAAARAEALEEAAKRCGAIRHDLRDEANREGGILPASMRKYHEANGAAARADALLKGGTPTVNGTTNNGVRNVPSQDS